MSTSALLLIALASVVLLLLLVIKAKAHPFVALLIVSLLVARSEEHTSELQSHSDLVCRLLLEKR